MADIINDLEIVKRRIERLNGFGEEAEVIDNVISLLKAQEPRVMTLDEIRTMPEGTDVWIESGGTIRVDTTDKTLYDRWFATILNLYLLADYGIAWRAWTARPTNEQRAATPLENADR